MTDTFPASPAKIKPDASLSELQAIAEGWREQARAADWPAQLFEIGYLLGKPQGTRYSGRFHLLRIDERKIELWANVSQQDYNPARRAWNMRRRVAAFADDRLVVSWSWYYALAEPYDPMPADAQQEPEPLFVPGEWLRAVLELLPKADAAREAVAKAEQEAERIALAGLLLVGQKV